MISFKSQITEKVLNYLFLNPHESLYINELSRNLDVDKRNLVKKLKELESEGVLKSNTRGNLKLYSINNSYPLYKEYKKIISHSLGFENKITDVLKNIPKVREAYIFGSYATDKMQAHSDIDLLVVGEHSILKLQRQISGIQKQSGRQINVINMSSKEFAEKMKTKDPLVTEVLNKKHIKVI